MKNSILNNEKTFVDQISKKYEDAMKRMGIDISSYQKYSNAEEFGKNFKKTTINKNTSVAFSSSL